MPLEKQTKRRLVKSGLPVRTSRRGKAVLVTIPMTHVRKLERLASEDGDTLAGAIRRLAVRAAARKRGAK